MEEVGPAQPSVWLIGGPTASGKSALALDLAERIDGEIVNADSMQVYADLAILTARPGSADLARAPHHLYGVADAADPWSAGRWARAAAQVLADIALRGRPAMVVGGTGLYFRALTHGLAETPDMPAALRDQVAAALIVEGEAPFRRRLAEIDPAAEARIAIGDRQRLVRALAVFEATGRPLSDWQAATKPLLPPGAWRGCKVEPFRGTLYARCDARLALMLDAGALEEVERLLARALDPALPAMKALGVPELSRAVRGEISSDQALADARQATRRYAKRQLTWFRNQTPDWEVIVPE